MSQFNSYHLRLEPHKRVLDFPQNERGRDFVVGDIHGAFSSVLDAMQSVGFCQNDRLFCVGDLVDRGPNSSHVAEFLDLPGVYSVRGNHEEMIMAFTDQDLNVPAPLRKFMADNGAQWWLDEPKERKAKVLERISKLPYAMEIQTVRGNVGIVHADVPPNMSWPQFRLKLCQGDASTIEVALEGRERIKKSVDSGVEGIGRVFVGHTIQWDKLKRLGNLYAIDGGAVFSETHGDVGHLNFVSLITKTETLTNGRANFAPTFVMDEHTNDLKAFGIYTKP